MNPKQRPVVYHQTNSLSSFIAGAFVGALAALALSTKEGRSTAKDLLNSLKDFSEEAIDSTQDLIQKSASPMHSPTHPLDTKPPSMEDQNIINRLRRQPPSSSSFFTQNGKSLKP